MIRTIKHRGLKRLHEGDDASGVLSQYAQKIRRILFVLDNANEMADVDLPGFRLHSLKGDMKGFWSISVSRNWRVIFRFDGQDVTDLDMVDYH